MDTREILEKTKTIEIAKPESVERIKEMFNLLHPLEVDVVLDFLKKLGFYKIKIENFDLTDEEAYKQSLINLAIKNKIKEIESDLKKIELKYLSTLKQLGENNIKIYLLHNLHSLTKDTEIEELKYGKMILKYFHDLGGFSFGLWGIKINYESFKEVLEKLNEELLEKLENKIRSLNKDEFIMISNLLSF